MRAAAHRCWSGPWGEKFLLKHFLPLGLVTAVIIGLSWPEAGAKVASAKAGDWGVVQTVCVCCIFVVSGMTLKTDDIKQSLRAWPATLYGVFAILVLTPLLALVPTQLSFLPTEFQYGLLLFCSMPTTINSGVALVNAAKGSFALALLLTVASNLLGVFTCPFYLGLLLKVSGIKLDAAPLLIKLLLTILLPLAVGKAARDLSPPVLAFVKRRKTYLSNFSNFCLIMIPWMKLSVSQPRLVKLSAGAIFGLLACGLVIHFAYLALNYTVATYVLRLRLALRKAVVIMGSQKTLPMAMTLLSFFPPELGEPGLIAIPCILCHLTQIFADAFLCSKWAQYTDPEPVAASPATATQKAVEVAEVSLRGSYFHRLVRFSKA